MEIYQPAEDSYLLQKYVKVLSNGRVLDLGTGSGIQTLSLIGKPEVKEIFAIDINESAVKELKEKTKLNKKVRVIKSDLFSELDKKFDTIIFNAPYLPQDFIEGEPIVDPALYGGKHGWEILERFFLELSDYLEYGGSAIVLFSSHTNKKKIDEFIEKNMFSYNVLEEKNVGMLETLYVYQITRSQVCNSLLSRGVKEISYLAKGSRGMVFKAKWNSNEFVKTHLVNKQMIDVVIKVKLQESKADNRIRNEVYWLRKSNKVDIGPKLLFYQEDYFLMEFIDGIFLPDFLEKNSGEKGKIIPVLRGILSQCRQLDLLKVSKEEFIRPLKNVIVTSDPLRGDQVVLLDFERCHNDPEPSNVTQFCSFLGNHGYVDKSNVIELSQKYKQTYSQEDFVNLMNLL